MSHSLASFAQGSTVGSFLLNVATIGHNAIFHGTTEVPHHLKSAQSIIQKIRDDIRNFSFSAYLERRQMTMYTTKCNKLCDQVEKQLVEYYQAHMIKRYYMTSGVAITKAIKLNQQCRQLYESIWTASTDAKARKERELGLNFVEKSEDVLSEPPLDDSGLENEVDLESPPESPNTDSNPVQDSSSLLTAVRFVLPPRISPRVTSPDTGGALVSLPNFLRAMLPLLITQNSAPTPGATFEMTTLNDTRVKITSTPEEGANE